MPRELTWREAIERVLADAPEPMHYAEIAQAIVDAGYRQSVGATPANTVRATLAQPALAQKVEKVQRGYFRLLTGEERERFEASDLCETDAVGVNRDVGEDGSTGDLEEAGLLNAFGLLWRRSDVAWDKTDPALFGMQLSEGTPVDFSTQVGVYLLYDGAKIIYVGRVTGPRLGRRLREHTRDRLSGRWDRFSWFGVRPVRDNGSLGDIPSGQIDIDVLVITLEAFLIEGLEPPQNRRQGDGLTALEFIQHLDPSLERNKLIASLVSAL